MPLEIRELHIKVALGEGREESSGGSSSTQEDQEKIIKACVEQVLEILKEKEER